MRGGAHARRPEALSVRAAAVTTGLPVRNHFLAPGEALVKSSGDAMKSKAVSFEALREYIAGLPVVDCHDHAGEMDRCTDIPPNLCHIYETYVRNDLISYTLIIEENGFKRRWHVLSLLLRY